VRRIEALQRDKAWLEARRAAFTGQTWRSSPGPMSCSALASWPATRSEHAAWV